MTLNDLYKIRDHATDTENVVSEWRMSSITQSLIEGSPLVLSCPVILDEELKRGLMKGIGERGKEVLVMDLGI